MVKESLAAIWNLKQIRNSYYIHSSRKISMLNSKPPIISHDDVMKYLNSLYPNGRFSSDHSSEFRQVYDQINNLVELDDFDHDQIKDILRDPRFAVERKAYLERYLEIDMLCRINLERGKMNVQSVL